MTFFLRMLYNGKLTLSRSSSPPSERGSRYSVSLYCGGFVRVLSILYAALPRLFPCPLMSKSCRFIRGNARMCVPTNTDGGGVESVAGF